MKWTAKSKPQPAFKQNSLPVPAVPMMVHAPIPLSDLLDRISNDASDHFWNTKTWTVKGLTNLLFAFTSDAGLLLETPVALRGMDFVVEDGDDKSPTFTNHIIRTVFAHSKRTRGVIPVDVEVVNEVGPGGGNPEINVYFNNVIEALSWYVRTYLGGSLDQFDTSILDQELVPAPARARKTAADYK